MEMKKNLFSLKQFMNVFTEKNNLPFFAEGEVAMALVQSEAYAEEADGGRPLRITYMVCQIPD